MSRERGRGSANDRTHLLAETSIQESDEDFSTSVRPSSRLIVVEPYLLLYNIADKAMDSVFSQYLYISVGHSMGIDVNNLTIPGDNSSRGNCDLNQSSDAFLEREKVQSATAEMSLHINLVGMLPTIFALLVLGSMSDRVGRKINFIIPPIGGIFKAALVMIAVHFNLPPAVFYGNTVELLLGGLPLVQAGCFTYIADTAAEKYIPLRMTILTILIFSGTGLASIGIGYWIENAGYFWPVLFVIGIKCVVLGYAIFFIPEVVRRTPGSWRTIKLTDLIRPLQLFLYDNGNNRKWKLIIVTLALLFQYLFIADEAMTVFQLNYPLCWGSVEIGIFFAVDLVVNGVTGLLGGACNRWIAAPWLIIIGNTTFMIQRLYVLLVKNSLMMFFSKSSLNPIVFAFLSINLR